jgi:hypothetical protein
MSEPFWVREDSKRTFAETTMLPALLFWLAFQFGAYHPVAAVLFVVVASVGTSGWAYDGWGTWAFAPRLLVLPGWTSNAIAIVLNGMHMPVVGMDEPRGLWIPAVDPNVPWLIDRFFFFSIGDIVIGIGALVAIGCYVVHRIARARYRSRGFRKVLMPFLDFIDTEATR